MWICCIDICHCLKEGEIASSLSMVDGKEYSDAQEVDVELEGRRCAGNSGFGDAFQSLTGGSSRIKDR